MMPDKVIKALEVVRKGYVYKKNGQDVISLDVRFVDMILAILKEQGKTNIKEPCCLICNQSSCRYWHEAMQSDEYRGYVRTKLK